jgi:hypothetical protein
MPSLNAYLRLSLCIVIDFASFPPPLVTVGRLGSDSGQLELATRGETGRQDIRSHICSYEDESGLPLLTRS